MGNRKYFSEQEVTRIIKRAVEVQQNELATKSEYTPGVSLEELERIAGEIGVSPEALARAVAEGGEGKPKRSMIRFRESYERVVSGELDPMDFDVVTSACKPMGTNQSTGAQQVGRNLKIKSWTGVGEAVVDVSSRKGRTKIEVTSSPVVPIMASLYPCTFAAIFAGIGVGTINPLAGVATSMAVLGLGAWGTLKMLSANHRRAKELADKIAAAVDEHIEEATPAARVAQAAEEAETIKIAPPSA